MYIVVLYNYNFVAIDGVIKNQLGNMLETKNFAHIYPVSYTRTLIFYIKNIFTCYPGSLILCFTYISGHRRCNARLHSSQVVTALYVFVSTSFISSIRGPISHLSISTFSGTYRSVQFPHSAKLLGTSTWRTGVMAKWIRKKLWNLVKLFYYPGELIFAALDMSPSSVGVQPFNEKSSVM
jgi:hypothetical protein